MRRGCVVILAGSVALAGGCERVLGLSPITPVDAAVDAPPPSYVQAVLADHPIGYFRLGETTGVTAIDLIGGEAGTYVGNVVLGVPGAFADDPDPAAAFDGDNSAVQVGNRFDFVGTMPFSLEAWIKPSFSGSFHTIASRWAQPTTTRGYTFWQNGDKLGFERDIDAAHTSVVFSNTDLMEGKWTHVVATYEGTTLTLYIDGRQAGTASSDVELLPATVPFMIGATNGNAGNSPFLGTLDEVAIYDHALPADHVDAHFQAGGGQR